jgi:hypothetical protein
MKASYCQVAECPLCGKDHTDQTSSVNGAIVEFDCACGAKLRVTTMQVFDIEIRGGVKERGRGTIFTGGGIASNDDNDAA